MTSAPQPPPPSATWDDADSAKVDFALACHSNLQGMVQLADAKAAAVIGLQGIVVALLGSNLIDRLATAAHEHPFCMILLGGGTLACSLASLGMAIGALLPRFPVITPPTGVGGLMWIKDLDAFKGSTDTYAKQLQDMTPADAVSNLAHENLKISALLGKKYGWLRWSLRFVGLASLGWGALLVWALLTKQACS